MGEPMSEPASEGATGPVRVGVIGVGAMGAAHVDNLSRWTPGAVVSRVYDLDGDRAAHIAAGIGALPSPSAEGVIADDQVDAVLVAAPDPLHEELALACLGAGKPTLLEKPLATSPDGSRRVLARAWRVAGDVTSPVGVDVTTGDMALRRQTHHAVHEATV